MIWLIGILIFGYGVVAPFVYLWQMWELPRYERKKARSGCVYVAVVFWWLVIWIILFDVAHGDRPRKLAAKRYEILRRESEEMYKELGQW